MQKIYDVIIIGGGPAGVGATVEANALGLKDILLVEKGDNHSQTIRKFYKDNKRVDKDYKGQVIDIKGSVKFEDGSKESTLNYFDQLLDNEEIDTAFNSEVESVEKEDGVFTVTTSKAVFKGKNVIVAIGKMGKPNKPSYKIPPSISSIVNFNLDNCSQGEKLLVVGGGNSAIEYALELAKINTVTLNYRRTEFSRLNEINAAQLKECHMKEMIRLKLGIDIVSLENNNGQVQVNYTNGTSTIYDRVLYAIGGTTPVDFLKKCSIVLDSDNNPIMDENYETKVEGLYISGDIVGNGGGSIAMALNHSYSIIKHILSK